MIYQKRKQTQGNQFFLCILKDTNLEMPHQLSNKQKLLKNKFNLIKKMANLDIQLQKNQVNHFKLDYKSFQQYLRIQKINFILLKYLLKSKKKKKIHIYRIGIKNLILWYVELQEHSIKVKNKNYSINHLVSKSNKK
ncbi:unnamed protein product [Paramecium sonneborni]|uniref:Uncharacterized protein n=1 Tax=Paramecium sonneborni TaxID=65129 RepID=A0A8S1KR59_9CILI|nr:unnamed protein product [Paramecium sonneborni]